MRNKALILLLFGSLLALSSYYPERARTQVTTAVSQVTVVPTNNNRVLVVTGEYPPYTSAQLPGGGFFTQRVAAVFDAMGLEYEVRFLPWARCEEMVRNGEAWASFPYAFSEKNAQTYNLSETVFPSNHSYFYLKGNAKLRGVIQDVRDIADLRQYTVGGANGYWYGSQSDLHKRGLSQVEWAEDIYGLARMLYNRRIDVFIEDELVGWEVITKLYPGEQGQFATLSHKAQQRGYFLIISKSYPESDRLLTKFNMALQRLQDAGAMGHLKTIRKD